MKKLIATLFVMTLGLSLVAVADPTYTLKDGTYENAFAVLEPTQFNPTNNTTYYTASNLLLDYTVSGSVNRTYEEMKKVNGQFVIDDEGNYVTQLKYNTKYDLAHITFQANNNFRMALFVDIDNKPTAELRVDSILDIKDYGIYFFEDNDPTSTNRTYISLLNGDVEIKEGQNFGVYYDAATSYTNDETSPYYTGHRDDTVVTRYTTSENWVGSFDGYKNNNHQMNADAAWYSDTKMNSPEAIFCMFQGPYEYREAAYLEWEHVEFGFVTTGQPLPGTLATILISGLCAGALRKRSKKH